MSERVGCPLCASLSLFVVSLPILDRQDTEEEHCPVWPGEAGSRGSREERG
jgi:hypothetical protein